MIQPIPMLVSYVLTECLGESLQALVYKGHHKKRPELPLTIKILKQLSDRVDQKQYLRQKIERLKVLHDPRACTPLVLETDGSLDFIVQPWFEGRLLGNLVTSGQSFDLSFFLSLACTLGDVLQAVHDAGITHGGVKPHNILVQEGTHSLWLIDFITPLDIRNVSHFIYDSEFVRHTLAYTSPEQTGRINYRVDYSTDLYSLGVVFYEMLTGKLPYFSSDPLELIHSHLAEEAVRADQVDPNVPRQLGSIISRLLSKQPEKRYQSAAGLRADLIRCRDDYEETGCISDFPKGLHDHTRRVIFISKLVGRRAERQKIQREYSRVIDGQFRAVLVSGLSGIGKTRLIQELQRPLVQDRGYFTSGKFDQYQKNIPYSSLIQALRNLMRTYLTESHERVAQWKQKIQSAVGSEGQVVMDVVPELEFIIGQQPEVMALPPVEARNRFNNLFGCFLACLASEENPLVLFIDDLQWCDSATFDFLQNIFINSQEHPHLFFIGAYRHNEVDNEHPLSKLIHHVQEQGHPLCEIRLEALNDGDCHEIVAYILDSPLASTDRLAQFIAQLAEGNPLFVSESLAWLYNEDLLSKDERNNWQWDMSRIRETDMPETVVGLFSSKVSKLAVETLRILNQCACMGNRFAAEDVALILDIDFETLFESLKPVLNLGMILENKTDLQFVHDRVHEAVLSQIDAELRREIHWRTGNLLLGRVPEHTDLEALDNLFAIVAHLNRGCPESPDEKDKRRLAQMNFHAGNKALDSLAGDAANDFFSIAHDYLPEDSWQAEYEFTFRTYQKLAKTHLMCGHYEASEGLLNQLIQHATSDLDKAEALAEQTTSLSSFGNFIKAIETANRGLSYFDKAIPDDPDQAMERMRLLMNKIEGYSNVWDRILNMPFTQARKSKVELAFYSELIPDLYMSGLVPQLYLSAAQSTLHCLSGGMDESVIYSFSIMALNLGEQEEFELAFRYQDLAHDLCARYSNTFGATRGINGIVWCNMHSRSHPREIVDYCQKGVQSGKNCGDLYNSGLCYGPLMWNHIIQGNNLYKVNEVAEECLNFSKKNQLSFSTALAEAVFSGWIAPMKSAYTPVDMESRLAHWEAENYVAASGSYFVLLGFAQYFRGEHDEAAASLKKVEDYLHGLTDNVLKRLWYAFRILNRLKMQEVDDWQEIESEIAPLLAHLEIWGRLGPLLRPYIAFIHAEIARVRGSLREARNLYLDAIAEAQLQAYTQLAAYIYESLADLLEEHHLGDGAIYYAEALHLYRDCNIWALYDALQSRQELPSAEGSLDKLEHEAEIVPLSTLPDLDVNYLVKSTLALSAEIEPERLLEKIMNVVMESSGANSGYLLMKEQDALIVAAENHVGRKQAANLQRRTMEEIEDICQGIVNYVLRTRRNVVLGDASGEGDFKDSPEVRVLGLHSVLCLPVLMQADMIGILYLENRLSKGIFTPEKISLTTMLTQQAAISLENARMLEETRRAYRQLQESQEHMMQMEKLSSLGTLVGGVAHEINNPLMGVMNYVEFAQDKSKDPKIREVLGQASQQILRIRDIVHNMLLHLRSKPGSVGSCGVSAQVFQTLKLLEGELKRTNIDVHVELPDDLPAVVCSQDTLQQVLINLILNARDALADIGQPRISISAHCDGAMLTLAVCDNGAGIPEEIRSRIFDPFFTTKPPGKGTGLGLSVSLRLLQDIGGDIKVSNTQGEGCCIELQFVQA